MGNKGKSSMKEEVHAYKAEFTNEGDKVKDSYEEAHQIIAKVSKELNKTNAEFASKANKVKNSAKEGLQTAEAKAAQLADKAKAEIINEEWAKLGDKVKAELANKADKVKSSVNESTPWTKAKWAD